MNLRSYLEFYNTQPTWLIYAIRDQAEEVRGKKSDVSTFPVPVLAEPNNRNALDTSSDRDGEAREGANSKETRPSGKKDFRGGETLLDWTQRKLFWSWYDRNH